RFRNQRLCGLTLRIFCKLIWIELPQALQYSRRASVYVFVKVEAQPLTPSQWRVVRRQPQQWVSRNKHARTSGAQNSHVLAILPRAPDTRWPERSSAKRRQKPSALK